jgi:hypothetical protein
MDHVVCLDASARELETLVNGSKSMIIRGSDVRDFASGDIAEGDVLYFIGSREEREVKARGIVSSVYNTESLSFEESFETIIRNQDKLQLPDQQFYRLAGKKYLVLIRIGEIEEIEPFTIERSTLPYTDDWLPVGKIELFLAGSINR